MKVPDSSLEFPVKQVNWYNIKLHLQLWFSAWRCPHFICMHCTKAQAGKIRADGDCNITIFLLNLLGHRPCKLPTTVGISYLYDYLKLSYCSVLSFLSIFSHCLILWCKCKLNTDLFCSVIVQTLVLGFLKCFSLHIMMNSCLKFNKWKIKLYKIQHGHKTKY